MYGLDGFGYTGERFQNFNMEMETSVIGEEAPVDKIYLVPAEYNVCSYINDSSTIDGMERVAIVQHRKMRSSEFTKTSILLATSSMQQENLISS